MWLADPGLASRISPMTSVAALCRVIQRRTDLLCVLAALYLRHLRKEPFETFVLRQLSADVRKLEKMSVLDLFEHLGWDKRKFRYCANKTFVNVKGKGIGRAVIHLAEVVISQHNSRYCLLDDFGTVIYDPFGKKYDLTEDDVVYWTVYYGPRDNLLPLV